jgi:hypothetical protein
MALPRLAAKGEAMGTDPSPLLHFIAISLAIVKTAGGHGRGMPGSNPASSHSFVSLLSGALGAITMADVTRMNPSQIIFDSRTSPFSLYLSVMLTMNLPGIAAAFALVLMGVAIWEVLSTIAFDWSIISRQRKWRWPMVRAAPLLDPSWLTVAPFSSLRTSWHVYACSRT